MTDPSHSAHPAVFFDRDNTLTEDKGYTHRPEDLAWIPGAIEAVRLVNGAGGLAVVVTNQSGVGRGYYDEAAVLAFHEAMQADLAAAGARIDALYFCPFHAEATVERYRHPDHPDRKPNPGMIVRAIEELGIDPARSVIVGDHEHDVAAGRAAGVAGLLYEGGDLSRHLAPVLRQAGWSL